MGFDISVQEKQKFILVRLFDDLSKDDIDKALDKILEIKQSKNISNILCNQLQLKIPPNQMVVFDTAQRFSREPFLGLKMAILRNEIPKGNHFFETVATNRGGLVKVFDDENQAILWLAS